MSDLVGLKERLRAARSDMDENHAVRLHRAHSWLLCAEEQVENSDLAFIALWIAFNACYGVDDEETQELAERALFQKFIIKLVTYDKDKKIYNLLWTQFSGPVKALIKNQYLFKPFWDAQYQGGDVSIWKHRFEKSSDAALIFLKKQMVPELLSVVLDRLYVLRNQLMHGGATYKGKVNREQVNDGHRMLTVLMPIIIEIMLNAVDEDWGDVYYPVVEKS